MELPTMNGKYARLGSPQFQMGAFLIIGAIWLLQGCGHPAQSKTMPPIPPPSSSNSTLALEVQAEAETLRAALAAERIKTAKQAAEVRAARQKADSLKARELEHTEKIGNLKTELASLKEERDKLRMEVAQLRAKTAAVPQVLQLVTQMRTMETSLNGLSSSLESLSDDIATLRDEVELQKITAKSTRRSPANSSGAEGMVGTDLIVIKPGDSLWQLAQTYGTTVQELQRINELTGSTIVTGQFLKIPSPEDLEPGELAGLPESKDQSTP